MPASGTDTQPERLPWLKWTLLGLVFLGLGLAWRFTELRDLVDPEKLSAWVARFRTHSLAPLFTVGLFVAGTLLMFPVTALLVMTAMTFPTGEAIAYSFIGAELGAAAGFALGRVLGGRTVRRLAGSRVQRISLMLARRGILSVATIRLMPVAPFTVVNLVMGASHVKTRDFLIGNLLGLVPGIIALNLFGSQLVAAIKSPDVSHILILVGVVAGAMLVLWLLRRALRQVTEKPG